MALVKMSFLSTSLMREVEFTAYLPFDEYDYQKQAFCSKPPFKTLYLLHGIFGYKDDWTINSNVIQYAANNNLAIIMPSGENSFYVNNDISGVKYADYFFKELVDVTRKVFPLSSKKEDTYLAGLSMGGFGALRNGIINNQTFSKVGAFSPAIALKGMEFPGNLLSLKFDYIRKNNPEYFDLYSIAKENKDNMPKLFMGCGTQDFLIEANREFVKYLKSLKVDVEYFEEDDGHTWSFWDLSIKRFIEFLKG